MEETEVEEEDEDVVVREVSDEAKDRVKAEVGGAPVTQRTNPVDASRAAKSVSGEGIGARETGKGGRGGCEGEEEVEEVVVERVAL